MYVCEVCGSEFQDYGVFKDHIKHCRTDSDVLEPKIGRWYSLCCHQDLERIEDKETLREVQEDKAKGYPIRVWNTKSEALEDIARDWELSGSPETAEEVRRMKEGKWT